MSPLQIGLVGGRGFVGAELIALLKDSPHMQLAFASSSSKVNEPIPNSNMEYISLQPSQISKFKDIDALVLALPNGQARHWVREVELAGLDLCILDISADYRFCDDWVYGLPEINNQHIRKAKRISNPGCYATAAQLALFALRDILALPPVIFGVSGYSGAGATPNPRNDPKNLKDNLLPYTLSDHIHEREISLHLGQQVRFSPHVASFFRGLSLTIHMDFAQSQDGEELRARLEEFYQESELVKITREIPKVADVAYSPNAVIGGLDVSKDGRHGVVVSVLDNLLKGAASQAMQNLELALLKA